MASLYALQGSGSSGKSDTIIKLLELVCTKYPKAKLREFHRGRDVNVIIENVRGKSIGIESQGDPNSRLEDSLGAFKAEKCDIVFCSCRTRGMTVDWINALSPPYKITFVQKAYARGRNAQDAINAQQASDLIELAGL